MAGRKTSETGAGPLFAEADSAAMSARPGVAAVAAPAKRVGLLPIGVVAGLVGIGLWGAWVTKNVVDEADLPPIARAQLSSLVGEYVQAQARSATPPEQVMTETKAFMGEIEANLKARGARGQIVLVGEAVLTDNVPDITAELRREIYKKVKMPQVAAAPNNVMGAMRSAMAEPSAVAAAGGAGAAGN